MPTAEQQMADLAAVMDTLGMSSATIIAFPSTQWAALLFAAQSPERVRGLVLVNPIITVSEPDPDAGWTPESYARFHGTFQEVFAAWGSGLTAATSDEVLGSPFNRRLAAMLERCSAPPATARAHWEWLQDLDARDLMASITVPVRVLHQPGGIYPEPVIRRAASLIPGSSFATLPLMRPGAALGEIMVPISDHLQEMATGTPPARTEDRFLGTVLFTDVVGSTGLLSRIGDAGYRELRADHERQVRSAVADVGGELITVMGDGTLSVFDGPTAAIRCAVAIRDGARESGLEIRCGVHTGELEREAANVSGLAVHIGARVSAAAGPGQIVVSRTVRDLTAGSGLQLTTRGVVELKGIPGEWELFTLTDSGAQGLDVPAAPSIDTPLDRLTIRAAKRMPRLMRLAGRVGNKIDRPVARSSSN